MSSLEQSTLNRARKNEQIFLQRLASYGQAPAADQLEVDESTISRLKTDAQKVGIRFISELLAIIGLKIVPNEYVCRDPEYIQFLEYGCDQFMQLKRSKQRAFGEPEDAV